MDRSQYGLKQPTDFYRPFDIVTKKKPLPGYALLADLQASVPPSRDSTPVNPHHHHHASPQPFVTVTHNTHSPVYSNGAASPHSTAYPSNNTYFQESREEVRTETRSSGPEPSNGVQSNGVPNDELDSLLRELTNKRQSSITDRAAAASAGAGDASRPSMDSLLQELNSVSSQQQARAPSHHLSNGVTSHNVVTASTATRDLDDLMAELNGFKEDRSWVHVLEGQVENKNQHPEDLSSSVLSRSAVFKSSASSYSSSAGGRAKASSPQGKPPTTPPPSRKSGTPPLSRQLGTPPPRPPTPRSAGKATPPPRPPAPAEMVGAPMTLPYPEEAPPVPPPPSSCGPTMRQSSGPASVQEPHERPDSGGPVRRNDAAYRWVTDVVKYEISAPPEEDPPIIPEPVPVPQNEILRSPALVRKFQNKNDTYAKPEQLKSPSPPKRQPSPPLPAPPPPKPKEPTPPAVNELDCMLGSLANHMTEQGVTTTQKGCCSACDKPIVGQVITALGKTWHPEHFTCTHCQQELGSKNFFEREGKPYCESCYHDLFSPRCAYCDGPILDKCVTALQKNWHPEHFFCAQCGNTFGDEGFHEKDDKAYCRKDYYNMFAPKCGGCNNPIMENYISALNAQWHPECFVCRDCQQPFSGGSFFDHEGMPYCETHYHAKRGSLCFGCHKPITGRCITAMFRKYHPEHFKCSYCMKQLNKGTFKEQNDKPYCHGCFDKLYG